MAAWGGMGHVEVAVRDACRELAGILLHFGRGRGGSAPPSSQLPLSRMSVIARAYA
jgi:hypothetical protein